MMLLSEEAKKTKLCPFLLSNPQVAPEATNCKGDDCMVWGETANVRDGSLIGYCGLSHAPRPVVNP